MGTDDSVDDERRRRRRCVVATLQVVQHGGASRESLAVLLVPIGDLGVEIPAVVVETRRVGYRADIIERVALEYLQADDDIRDLNAEVVNVVLHFNRHATKSLNAGQRIAKSGVA